jgi:hypothetical protein
MSLLMSERGVEVKSKGENLALNVEGARRELYRWSACWIEVAAISVYAPSSALPIKIGK